MGRPLRTAIPPLLVALLLAACGGGGGGGDEPRSGSTTTSGTTNSPDVAAVEAGAPAATGNTATDGINWFNFRRQQTGLQPMARNTVIDAAAQGHSDYQRINREITHEQVRGREGFTGVTTGDRLSRAGYNFKQLGVYGEVISSTFSTSGVAAAEDLIAAIYHRFVIFEPTFNEVGGGFATVAGGNTYFTTNFAIDGLQRVLGNGNFVVYPYADQTNVARNFMSDNEAPDPVPDRNEVGYPISVHADFQANITVQEFAVRPEGGSDLPVRILSRATDRQTPESVAAIIPLDPLASNITYEVRFNGLVDGTAVTRKWKFRTR